VNGQEISQSPYLLFVNPGEPSSKHSSATFLAFSPLTTDSPPSTSLSAGDALFFTLNIKDSNASEISDDLDALIDSNRIKINLNSQPVLPHEVVQKINVSEYGEVKYKLQFCSTYKSKLEILMDGDKIPIKVSYEYEESKAPDSEESH
jgi:hypothetical protein